MARIVISYRRSDSAAITGRIFDKLSAHFGRDSVFMDVDNIPFGTDFRDHIRQVLDSCDVLVAVMGPQWIGPEPDGRHRIMDAADFVRMEVETALQRNVTVIPLLVGGTAMPDPANLPDTLGALVFRNAAAVDPGRDFHPHMDRLIQAMEKILPPDAGRLPSPARSEPKGVDSSAFLERARAYGVPLTTVALAVCTAILSYLLLAPWTQTSGDNVGLFRLLSVAILFGAVLVVCEYLCGSRRWYLLLAVFLATLVAWFLAYAWSYSVVVGSAPESRDMAILTGGFVSGAIGAALTGVSLSALRSWRRMGLVTLIGALAGLALYVDVQLRFPLLYFVWQIGFAAYFGWCVHRDRQSRLALAPDASGQGRAAGIQLDAAEEYRAPTG